MPRFKIPASKSKFSVYRNFIVKKYDGDSPFEALTALTIGRTNPRIPTPIKVRMPNPNIKMAGMLKIM